MAASEEHEYFMYDQRYAVECEQHQRHEEWVKRHQEECAFDHHSSTVRAKILVNEAWLMEKQHLSHQYKYVRDILKKRRTNTAVLAETEHNSPSPRRNAKDGSRGSGAPERICPCCLAPVFRLLLPKYRAMNLLRDKFERSKLEASVDAVRKTFCSDHEMMDDLLARFGPEDDFVDPGIWMLCIKQRLARIDERWREIGGDAAAAMKDGDAFPAVVRNLSIMRIFLEGSQAAEYCCDLTERARRDAYHRATLEKLNEQGTLFLQ